MPPFDSEGFSNSLVDLRLGFSGLKQLTYKADALIELLASCFDIRLPLPGTDYGLFGWPGPGLVTCGRQGRGNRDTVTIQCLQRFRQLYIRDRCFVVTVWTDKIAKVHMVCHDVTLRISYPMSRQMSALSMSPNNIENSSKSMMNKFRFRRLLSLVLLFLALPVSVRAQFYCTTNNGGVTLTGITNYPDDGVLNIPPNFNGLPVIGIGAVAFRSGPEVSVIIPDTVISIGTAAFENCYFLTNLYIGNGVTNIAETVFDGSPILTTVTVGSLNPSYSSLGGVLFDKNQTTLVEFPGGGPANYVVPATVTNIGTYAFFLSQNLLNITLPKGLANIENSAFRGCNQLLGAFFEGPPPTDNTGATFAGDGSVTVYYLPGVADWSSFYGSAPAVLWNPHFTNSSASFGGPGNHFGFNIAGSTNIPIVLQACSNLANPVWSTLSTFTLTNGSVPYTDLQSANFKSRFYRITGP